MAAISSSYATDSIGSKLSAAIFAIVVLALLLATSIQTFSMFLSVAYSALMSIVPRGRTFQIPLASKLPAKMRPYGSLLILLAIPISVVVISMISITFVFSKVALGLLDG